MRTEQVEDAIRAIKAGNKEQGRALLVEALKGNPRNEDAWLWLARAVGDRKQQKDCLEQVLKINPENEIARLGLAKLNHRSEKPPVPAIAAKQDLSRRLVISGLMLLLIGIIGLGAFGVIRAKNTEVIAVGLDSVLAWEMIDEAALLEVGKQIRTNLEDDKRQQLAVNPNTYNEYMFWSNAAILRYTGYLRVRLPVELDDAEMVEVQELILLYTFDGPTDIESPTMETVNVIVYVQVVDQATGELKIKKYEEHSAPFVLDCFACPTYAFDQCSVLQGCYWIDLR